MKTTLVLFIFLITFTQFAYSQNNYYPPTTNSCVEDDEDYDPLEIENSWDGWKIYPHGTIRTFNMFINIYWDDTPGLNPFGANTEWDYCPEEGVNQCLPTFFDDFIDNDYDPDNVVGMETRIFHESSFGDLIILGDYMTINVRQTSVPGFEDGFTTKELIVAAVNIINAAGGINAMNGHNTISDYDMNNDNIIDLVQVFIRNGISGYAIPLGAGSAGDWHNYEDILINGAYYDVDLCTLQGTGPSSSYFTNPTSVIIHEFSHWIFGSNAFHTSGGHSGGTYPAPYIGLQGGYGLMGLANSGLVCCNGYERWRMHWKHETAPDYISANGVISDISKQDGNKTFILRDFVSTGDAIRIKLPYIEGDASNQYIWLENHKVGLNNKLDYLRFSEYECRPNDVNGVYAYYQVGKDILSGTHDEVFPNNEVDNLKIISAEGNFDFIKRLDNTFCMPWGNGSIDEQTIENIFFGYQDQCGHFFDLEPYVNEIWPADFSMNYKKFYNSTEYNDGLPFLGDEYDVFQGNQKISISTNPTPFNTITHYNKTHVINNELVYLISTEMSRNINAVYLSGLSIEMVEISDYDYEVTIMWNDYTIYNDVRWAGNIELNEKLILDENKELVYNYNTTPTTVERDLTTGHFSGPSVFTCKENSIFRQMNGSLVEIHDMSELVLEEGSKYIINDADLVVKEDGILTVKSCADLIINGTGKLIVEDGGTICMEEGANLIIEDISNVQFDLGYLTGGCLPVTTANLFELFEIPPTYEISTEVNWTDEEFKFKSDLVIENGGVLNLSNTKLKFGVAKKIIVKQGGILHVDNNSLLTNHGCSSNSLWYGIEVWGDPTGAQNPIDQGWVELDNEATIENSEQGILAGHYEIPTEGDPILNPAYAGGIIQASHAHFTNNQISAQLYDYTANNSTSWFKDCEFTVNDDYIGSQQPENYMVINDMIDIEIERCVFENATSTQHQYCGILSVNSTIYIEGECDLETCNQSFTNMEYGIYATASNTSRHVDVRHTEFLNNLRGVYVGGMTNPRVTSNIFYLNVLEAYNGYGLYLDESTDYWVEDNLFERTSGYHNKVGIGIIVNNSGGDPNEIYLNKFNYVENAINVQGENRDGKDFETGLVLKCNDYNYTKFDETIIWEGPAIQNTSGMASKQGIESTNAEDMASNIFYYNETVADDYDDLNNGSNFFDYYFSSNAGDNNVEPMDFTDNTVDKIEQFTNPWEYETACEPGINPGGGGDEGGRGAMDAAQSDIESTEAILTVMIDGGDTEALNTDVENSTPPETVALYNELMGDSPNLSETVVESAIEKETVLPNAMIRDVMVANPHTAKSDVLLNKLDERYDPLPDYMKAQILEGRSIQTLKQELESQLAGHKQKKAKAMNSIIRYYKEELEDPVAASDSLLDLFQYDNTLKSSYRMAWLYLERGEYQSGLNVMSNIPNQFSLSDDEQVEYSGLSGIYGLFANGNTIELLDEGQIAGLQTLANGETGLARAYARNILISLGELDYEEPILHPDFYKTSSAIEEFNELLKAEAPHKLQVYPNPSTGFVILEYKLDSEAQGVIEVKDMSGKTIHSVSTSGKQDQLTIVTEKWQKGVYIATLKIDGKSIESVKFTLVK